MDDDHLHLSDIIEKCDLVAHVEILFVSRKGDRVRVRPIEVYKGTAENSEFEVDVPRIWLIPMNHWFIKGEQCVMCALGSPLMAYGRAGNMPISSKESGQLQITAYIDDARFFQPAPAVYEEGISTQADWKAVREIILDVVGSSG